MVKIATATFTGIRKIKRLSRNACDETYTFCPSCRRARLNRVICIVYGVQVIGHEFSLLMSHSLNIDSQNYYATLIRREHGTNKLLLNMIDKVFIAV